MRNQDESKNGLSRRGLLWTSAAAALGAVGMAGAAEQPAGATPAKSTDKPADKPAPKPAPKNETPAPANPLKIAVIGCGGQGRSDMRNFLQLKERIVALCDVDEAQIAGARKAGGEAVASAKSYTDYRKLFEDEKTFDTVLIATPDHWHAPIAKLAMKMGKHVYCEKPLTHSIAEARELGELARSLPKVVTQLGNQGSADGSMRRSVELIRAGVLGQIRDVHSWLGNSGPAMGTVTAVDADPIPDGFNWDMWCGPSPLRAYKAKIYHPFQWRSWFDFGNGGLADFCCHIYNIALRALDLTYATKIEVAGEGLSRDCYGVNNRLKMHFPARASWGKLDPVTLHWHDGGLKPDPDLTKDIVEVYKTVPQHGCLIIGEKGTIFTNPWNSSAVIKLKDEPRLKDITRHEATKDVPITLPRGKNHYAEFVAAVRGEGKAWSSFEFGAHLTEIGLTGVLALRVGHDIEWDAAKMVVKGVPEAEKIIRPEARTKWMG